MSCRANASSPDDLMYAEIIPCLALKSIGRFRCVSKSWRSLLSSSEFVKYHLKLHVNDPEKHILVVTDHAYRVYSAGFSSEGIINDDVVSRSDLDRRSTHLGPSCHGLVLLILGNPPTCLILMNPITKESLELPDIEFPAGIVRYGLGYDSVSDDYKVVSIILGARISLVYSVKMKTWRRLPAEELGYEYCSDDCVFVNGYIYWTNWSEEDSGLVAFNLASEECEKVPLPSGVSKECPTLYVPEGCLALRFVSGLYEIWVMKEHGVQDSWINIAKFDVTQSNLLRYGTDKIECLLNDDEILMSRDVSSEEEKASLSARSRYRVFAFNWRNDHIRWLDAVDVCFKGVGTFEGIGLVSPNSREEL